MRDQGGAAGIANYDVSRSGDWFVMIAEPSAPAPSGEEIAGLHLVLNFLEELRARVPN